MKKIYILIAFSFLLQNVDAQQLYHFTKYRDQWNVLNPASLSNNYLINEMNMSIGATHRQMWLGIEGAPSTQLLNWEFIPEDYNVTLGAHIINDKTGILGHTGIYGQFAYRLDIGRRVEQGISIGLNAGIIQYRGKYGNLDASELNGELLEDDNVIFPDFGIGAFYYYSDLFYAGLSIPQTFGLELSFRGTDGDLFQKRVQHVYAIVGGYFPVNWFGSDISFLEPSLWLRYVPNAPLSADLNVRYQISELFWTGLGTGLGFGDRLTSTLRFEAGVVLGETLDLINSQIKIGFGFDLAFAEYRQEFGNSIEINVVYSWYK